jgi:hypothetical protein
VPRSVTRALLVAALLVAAGLAAVGGLALRAPGVIAVGVAGLLAGLTAAAIAHDSPTHTLRSTVEAGVFAAAGTVGALLVVSGSAALLGGPITVALIAVTVLAWLLRSGRRSDHGARAARRARREQPQAAHLSVVPELPDEGPVSGLSTLALGREWLRTSAALASGLDAAARRAIVERREATLDELERRDPDGFARWLAMGPEPDSDPAAFVRGGPVPGAEAA